MIALTGVTYRRYAVLGLGRSGLAAAKSLELGCAEVTGWDENPVVREVARAAGIRLQDLARPGVWDEIDGLILSPGVSHLHPEPNPIVRAACEVGVPLDNDIGLFFESFRRIGKEFDRATRPEVVAVTGSNGKSTTSSLIHHVLTSAGRASQLAGNIGVGALDIEPPGNNETIVLEISSYQSDLASCLEPDIAVFLNFSPDHLDRHGGIGGYFSAKRRLFEHREIRRAIVGVDEPEGRFLAGMLRQKLGADRVVRISTSADGARGGGVVLADGMRIRDLDDPAHSEVTIDASEFAGLQGTHNLQNACAAYSACRSLGLSTSEIELGLGTFQGLSHRSQIVGRFRGVLCINDSKATNAESAEKALNAHSRILWIAGGLGKQGGISSISKGLKNVKKVYLVGASAEEFARQLRGIPYVVCNTIPQAVVAAAGDAVAGDTLLLSPAAASFDQYPDFEARGEHFMEEVRRYFR